MKSLYFFLLSLVLGLSCSCSKKTSSEKAKPLIVVSVSPYDSFIKKISGDFFNVQAAVPPNFNSHLFEPTPSQIQGFDQAVMWFGISEPFEKKLLLSLKSHNPNLIAVDLSAIALHDKNAHSHQIGTQGCSHHDHEGEDRHYWTDPMIALEQCGMILKALNDRFPEKKEMFERNYQTLKNEFISLDQSCKRILGSVKGSAIIISHPSLGYFCQRYDLIQLALECEGKTPLPEDLTKILQFSKQHPVRCVFAVEQFDNRGAISVSDYLKLSLYTINTNAPGYFENFKNIANDIAKGNK